MNTTKAAGWANRRWHLVLVVGAALGGGAGFTRGDPVPAWRERVEADWVTAEQVALLEPVSTPVTTEADAAGGCDGVKDGDWGFHTAESAEPWWQVDLGRREAIDHVVVWNRPQSPDRAARLRLQFSGDGSSWETVYQHDGTVFIGSTDQRPLTVRFDGRAARFVRVRLPGRTFLHLEEVEVFGAADPARNLALHRPADQSSVSEWSRDHRPPARLDWARSTERARENVRRLEAEAGNGGGDAGEGGGTPGGQGVGDAGGHRPPPGYLRARARQRRLALRNPLLDFEALLFTKRVPPSFSHMSDQYYGWWSKPGGGIYLLRGFTGDSPSEECLTGSFTEPGSFLRPTLSYDGTKVLFAWCRYYASLAAETNKLDKANVPEDAFYHLFEMNLDGTGVRRLTRGKYDDFDGRYLPDGRIVFLSTRRGQALQVGRETAARTQQQADLPDCYVRCGGGPERPVAVYTLHTMNPDGSGICAISPFEMFEWTPEIADDGSILYSRWDYIDRDNMPYMGLWSIHPDGSNARLVFKNHTKSPHCVFEAKPIPGSRRLVFTGSAHHAQTMGSLALLDPAVGPEGHGPITRLTPEVPFPEIEGWPLTSYANPWPLSERFHLVAWGCEGARVPGTSGWNRWHAVQRPDNGMALYLYDAELRTRELLWMDPDIACGDPIPVRPRPRPPVVASSLAGETAAEGRFLVADVAEGLRRVKPGAIRSLRIVAVPPKTHPTMDYPKLGITADDPGKCVLGTVPVEADGSAYFRVPAGVIVFFQALDEDGIAVQTMRSVTHVQPGQTLSCIGCHENRQHAPPAKRLLAAQRPPSRIAPGPDGSWPLRFDRLVQPLLDARCTSCHQAGSRDVAAAKFDLTPARAYESLVGFGKPSLRDQVWAAYRRGTSLEGDGVAAGSALRALLEAPVAHYDVRLTADERARLFTWMDTYAQRFGHFSPDQERELLDLRQACADLLEPAPAPAPRADGVDPVAKADPPMKRPRSWGVPPLALLLVFTARFAGAGEFEIAAWAFDRGNAKTFTGDYADGGPMIAYGGRSPVLVEYDIDFPASGSYRLDIRFAAAEARPVSLLLDGTSVGQVCRGTTGTWQTRGAQWEHSADLYVGAGKHTLRLQRSGSFPHVVSLRIQSGELPAGWEPRRPGARRLDDPPPVSPFEPFVPEVRVAALRLAIEDLQATFGPRYPRGPEWLRRLAELEAALRRPETAAGARAELVVLQREALLRDNPWIDFRHVLLVRRGDRGPDLGLPRNWESNSSLPRRGYDDALCRFDLEADDAPLTTIFKPERDVFLGDVDLHFDAERLLFSSVGRHDRWQVFELSLADGVARQLTGDQPDVDSYDACYLPDDRIVFTSTACFIGVPCVYGGSHVANLYRMDADGRNIRQLCFDQEHDWCPTVLNDGRVLYTRWEYADTPHSNTRLLFQMNPDGTGQMEFLGSNSYWPNSLFYARPIPGHPSRVVAVIGGHHDHPRMGELVLFDVALGRQEAAGAVQRIPGYGKRVEPIIRDGLTLDSWPKFLHPFPLGDRYFLVSCKPTPDAPWGVYLADVFDNLVPIRQQPDAALFEPIPLRRTSRPPVVPDKVDLTRKDAVVVLQDIYQGDGLRGVPRGTVKALRLFTYHFAYQNMGGLLGVVGADGPWDIKRVLGTVPVQPDGSAVFRIPANTPISVQPLDAEGKALQLMRSWMTAMPGETVQCVGCHDRQNSTPPAWGTLALRGRPAEITPWHGPTRGFSYAREVQPVIDRHCVGCHDGQPRVDGTRLPDLRGTERVKDWKSVTPGNGGAHAGRFSVGYTELQRHVRRPGIESDYHLLTPMEFHADTTDLVQLLKKGHHGVRLEAEAWDRLITWIDLNCPYHGTWGEEIDDPGPQRARRRELLRLYAGVDDDPEAVPDGPAPVTPAPVRPEPESPAPPPRVEGWPFDAAEAARRQAAAGRETRLTVDLGEGLRLDFALVPAGDFVMGSAVGAVDERPVHRVTIPRPFWMAVRETENRVFARFDPAHDSRVEDKNAYQFGIHGYPANDPSQPVVRVSWEEAMAFCDWLSVRTGRRFTLPSEAQWEYACRAGAATPFAYGDLDADFSHHANLADARLSGFASDPYTVDVPLPNPTPYDDWLPKDSRFNDGALLTVAPGRYRPNAWGLHDLHGNAAEWTLSIYAPYPYGTGDGREGRAGDGLRVVRGGSWRDVPRRATASFRTAYRPWQRVYNVGFRVISEDLSTDLTALRGR